MSTLACPSVLLTAAGSPVFLSALVAKLWRKSLLHHADIPTEDRGWFGAVPVTKPGRSLNDCARHGLSPDLLRQAATQAIRRGLVTQTGLGDVEQALKPFGGISS